MPVIDLAVGLLIAAAVVVGALAGLARALPAAGFGVGAVLGTRLPAVFGMELDSDFSLVVALPAALVLGAVAGALAEGLGPRVARLVRRRIAVDAAGGGLLAGSAAVVAVWALAPAASELRFIREPIERSELLGRMNDVLTAAGPKRTKELPPIDVLPAFAGRTPDIAAGDPDLLFDPDVLQAERSVVKIGVTHCTTRGLGSGWVARDGIVVTNAHVVSGARSIVVQPEGKGPGLKAVPIWFDGRHDVALLRVAQLRGVRALTLAPGARTGTAGATLGFPLGRGAIRRARLGPTTDRLIGSLSGGRIPGVSDKITGRLVTTVRGRAQPGNSGGPVVDARGRVLATVFAGGFTNVTLGVPNRFVRSALRKAGPRVRAGRC